MKGTEFSMGNNSQPTGAKKLTAEQMKKAHLQKTLLLVGGLLLAVAVIIVVTVLIVNAYRKSMLPYTIVDEATDYVLLNVSYTDAKGQNRTGNIVVQLDGDEAPITVANFKKLVGEKFYDGLVFHRIIEDFMIQGGGFTKSGAEKDAATIKGEFSSNGYSNSIKHERGVISMARTNVKDSASSQFFIVHKTSPHLDGKYAAFGYTVHGLDVVDAIATQKTNYYDEPIHSVVINYARFVTPVNGK